MDMHRTLRGIAGLIVLISLILAVGASYWWLLLAAFAGLDLLQSAFTDKGPVIWLLKLLGFKY